MDRTGKTLLEQLKITDRDIARRKALLEFGDDDVRRLREAKPAMEERVDGLVDRFYAHQTSVREFALLIGDKDTLTRLHATMRRYVLDLFSGLYDQEYVNSRLRIGMVHKRIGVGPQLYLAGLMTLKRLLFAELDDALVDPAARRRAHAALDKLLAFDNALVFETFIRSVVVELEAEKEHSEQYARDLERTVRERTRALEKLARTDARTGLRNERYLEAFLTRALRAAERRHEPLSVVFFDIDGFKEINDTRGHQHGDRVLETMGEAVRAVSRAEDGCFRYGGDEFCVVLPNCPAAEARRVFVDRLRTEIERRLPGVTVSVGVAETGPDDYMDTSSLLRRVDARMYEDKRLRRAEGRA